MRERDSPAKRRPSVSPRAASPPTPKSENAEARAQNLLDNANRLVSASKRDAAKRWLKQVVHEYPGTKAAEKAQALLNRLEGEPDEGGPAGHQDRKKPAGAVQE